MYQALFSRLGEAIENRNSSASEALLPGMPVGEIQTRLQTSRLSGNVDAVLAMYEWRNGSRIDAGHSLAELSLFPKSVYVSLDLETALEHYSVLGESLALHPEGKRVARRFFPMFWDNSTGYLAIDLKNARSRVVLLDPEFEEATLEAYASFEDFLTDAIRANEEDDSLTCFQVR